MAKTQGLASRFELASADKKLRTILRVIGLHGTGKTRLALTAPDPILFQSVDYGTEGVVEEFVKQGKQIYVREYDWNPGDRELVDKDGDLTDKGKARAQELRTQIEDDYDFALRNGAKTVVWDKESDIWQLYRYAEFGAPNDQPKDYAKLNARYTAQINKVKRHDANLILIQSMKDEWGTKTTRNSRGEAKATLTQTGNKVPWGYDRLDELVFAELCCRREDSEAGPEFYFDFCYPALPGFGKCRQAAHLSGQSIPAMTFTELGTLLIDGSEEEEWK